MIESIHIKNEASYGSTPESMTDLSKFNFAYGSNGTGKTTISRIIADETAYSDCIVTWRGGTQLETLVYNRDFIERNFNQPKELKGIFTLGEKDKETLSKIETAREELSNITSTIDTLKKTLQGENGNSGKEAELATLEDEFMEKCWALKQKHDEKFKDVFTGVRGSKQAFKDKLLQEASENSSTAVSFEKLTEKANTVFGETPQTESLLSFSGHESLFNHESDTILQKKIIGKTDVDIAAMIQKLGNSDWVKQGREFYEADDNICPFCQQETSASLAQGLNDYFDEAFEKDTAAVEHLFVAYKSDSEGLQKALQNLLENPSEFLALERIEPAKNLLDAKIQHNIQLIEEKQKELSKVVALHSLKDILIDIKNVIDSTNDKIRNHNQLAENLGMEREALKKEFWKYLLDNEIQTDLADYTSRKQGLNKAIESLSQQITKKNKEKNAKEIEIRRLEKDTTSIQPTIDAINGLIKSFGFQGFKLAKSKKERFYEIQRPDGTDAKETLSEGETSFIAFLYFYHLLKGSESESGMTTNRVIVFDDPVSSLDSDILFIVSSLIRDLFDEVRTDSGIIKQIFVFTHNVYFHKEVTFNPKRDADKKLKEETFWTVRKSDQQSKIQKQNTNPIRTSYELLWMEVRNTDHHSTLSIQNTLRRILEYYFKFLGNVDQDDILAKFEGREKLLCRSLFSWVNAGSHSALDDLYASIDETTIDIYVSVFRQIFEKTDHIAHYKMMMGEA